MANYLVTGGLGFIGSHLTKKLVRNGNTVRVIDNLSTGTLANITEKTDLHLLDIADPESCMLVCRGIDVVFHQAALGSVPRSVDDPIKSNKSNVTGTLNMLWAAKEKGVKRFIFASSSSVYGDNPALPKDEKMECLPVSPYAGSKLACEHYCRIFSKVYGLDTVSLRYFNVFGPRQNEKGAYACAIPSFINKVLTGSSPIVYGDGEQTRDFSYVNNIVAANFRAALSIEKLKGEVFNIACGERISLNQILDMLRKITCKDIIADYKDARAGDVRDTLASIKKAEIFLGYKPSVFFEEGLKKTVEWYKENME